MAEFKFSDRRMFNQEGEPRLDAEVDVGDSAASSASADAGAATEAAGEEASRPEVEFQSIVLTYYQEALVALGILRVTDPSAQASEEGPRPQTDLDAAAYFIGILEMLQRKTINNLTLAERKTLDDILYELRMAFVHVSRAVGEQG